MVLIVLSLAELFFIMLVIHNGIKYVNRYLPYTNHWLILLSLIPVALSTGTLFVFSVYGTQLAEKCHLSSSQTANLNIFATLGTAFGGGLIGLITDKYGTQLPILISCISISIGYKWLYCLYGQGSNSSMIQLLSAMFIIGIGSVSGYFSSIKAVTVNFPNYKSSAQSVTIASFAISSLIYLTIFSKIFKGDVSKFLYFLHVSCGLMLILGFIFVRADGYIDQLHHELEQEEEEEEVENTVNQNSPLIGSSGEQISNDLDSNSPIDEENQISKNSNIKVNTRRVGDLKDKSLNQSLVHPIFWIHYFILAIVQGLGQMYIYSVGYIIKAIHFHYTIVHEQSPNYQIPSLNELQALHVSLIAFMSFIGRLSSGPQADFLVNRLNFQRHWILILGLILMLIGHLLNSISTDLISQDLKIVNIYLSIGSCIIGYAYGFSFTCYPGIISDLFSMNNYSFIWGIMYTSTTIGLTVMTKLFGHIYDLNSDVLDDKTHEYICDKGSGCYNKTFKYTSCFTILAIATISGYIYHRRVQK